MNTGNSDVSISDVVVGVMGDGVWVDGIAADIGGGGTCAQNAMMNVSDDALGVCDILTNAGNDYACVR